MRTPFLAVAALVICLGCGSNAEEPPAMINPTGQASNLSAEEAARSNQYQEAGNRANAAMEEAARKMREAKGGKG